MVFGPTAGGLGMKKEAYDHMRMQAWISARMVCEAASESVAIAWADQIAENLKRGSPEKWSPRRMMPSADRDRSAKLK
jgi:hypothetical protein